MNIQYRLPKTLVNRESYIIEKSKGNRCLHLGCIDYSSISGWEEVIFHDRWLHRKIQNVAKEVIGIDIEKDVVDKVRLKGYNDIYYGDAQNLQDLDHGLFDLIICGEIIEHLPNPGLLLSSAHRVLTPAGKLLITTTNAYCARRFIKVAFGYESIHYDHTTYFSHHTLERISGLNGWGTIEQHNYRLPNKRPFLPYAIERVACVFSPNLGEGIISLLEQDDKIKS